MKSIQIVGFTPLGVILAERLTCSMINKFEDHSNVTLLEQASPYEIDNHWQSVSLFCLINLLKQCRILSTINAKYFGINVQHIKINKQILYSYLKLTTQRIQKYYLNLFLFKKFYQTLPGHEVNVA